MSHKQIAAGEEYWQRIERARQMSFDQTLLGGLTMHEEECERLRLDLQAQFPGETPNQIHQRVRHHYVAKKAAEPNPWTNLSPEEAAKFL